MKSPPWPRILKFELESGAPYDVASGIQIPLSPPKAPPKSRPTKQTNKQLTTINRKGDDAVKIEFLVSRFGRRFEWVRPSNEGWYCSFLLGYDTRTHPHRVSIIGWVGTWDLWLGFGQEGGGCPS